MAKEIFSRPDVFCNALGHELVHVYQFREHGFLKFVFKYFASSVYSFATGKHYYYNNVFEVEAYQKQGDFCEKYVKPEITEIKLELERILRYK